MRDTQPKKILITGAHGFVGARLMKELEARLQLRRYRE